MTPEGRVKKRVKYVLAEADRMLGRVYSNWPVPAGYGKPMLDCVGCFKGRFFAIETKAPGKKPTPLQRLTAEQMGAAGATVFIIEDEQGVEELWAWLVKCSSLPDIAPS